MEPSALHSQISLFEERNNCLYFALGLVSAMRALSEAMDVAAGEPRLRPDAQEADEAAGSAGDSALYFMLGLVAFAQRFKKRLDAEERAWRQRRARLLRAPGEAADSAPLPPRDLLR